MAEKVKMLFLFAAAISFVTLPLPAIASGGLQGDCVDCHTMHNSEQGAHVAQVYNPATGTVSTSAEPIENLLRMDCIACHASPEATGKLLTLDGGSVVPQVSHSGTDASGNDDNLAGGNFRYVAESGNRKGHNVVDLVAAETDNLFPPGHRHATAEVGAGGFDINKFTCAGSMGCHGYRGQVQSSKEISCDPLSGFKYVNGENTGEYCTAEDYDNEGTNYYYRTGMAALSGYDGYPTTSLKRGAHHQSYDGLKNDGVDPDYYDSPLAHSYRFILSLRGYGNEIDRWQNVDENSHNEYIGGYANNPLGDVIESTDFGATGTCGRCHFDGSINDTNSRIYTPGGTMTGFCITCHGKFHSSGSTNGTSGAFLRHPSDYVIPDRGEYAAYTVFDVSAPVARPQGVFVEGMTQSSQVNPGTDMVMCLSCHVAHGSAYDYMLRFDYEAMTAGAFADIGTATAEGGCLACHTTKGVLPENR